MINPKAPKLIYDTNNDCYMLKTKHANVEVTGIEFEEGRFGPLMWAAIDPGLKYSRDNNEAISACMLYQRLFGRAAEAYGFHTVRDIRKILNPGMEDPGIWDGWIRPTSTLWSHLEDMENPDPIHDFLLELDINSIKPLPEGYEIPEEFKLDQESLHWIIRNHRLQDWLKRDIQEIERYLTILLVGVAWWFDEVFELAQEWGIREALENGTPLYSERLQDNELGMRGEPTIIVSRKHVELEVTLLDRSKFTRSEPVDWTGLSLSDEKSLIAKMAPALLGQVCNALEKYAKAMEILKNEISDLESQLEFKEIEEEW